MTSKVLGKHIVRCDVPIASIKSCSLRRLLFAVMNTCRLPESIKNPLKWTIRGILITPVFILVMIPVLCYTPREAWNLKNKSKFSFEDPVLGGELYRCRVLVVKEWLDND